MAGTKAGGQAAAKTNKIKYGKDFYSKIGSAGGKAGITGGFFNDSVTAKKVGAIGGKRSKRGYKLLEETKDSLIYKNSKTGAIAIFAKPHAKNFFKRFKVGATAN